MSDESSDMIEQQMESTRASLSNKLIALEHHVAGNVNSATMAVQSVREAVRDSASTVKEEVREAVRGFQHELGTTLDVRSVIQEHPLSMLGGAAVVGVLTGIIAFRQSTESTPVSATELPRTCETPRPHTPSVMDSLGVCLGNELRKLGVQAVTHASQSLGAALDHAVRNFWDQTISTYLAKHAEPKCGMNTPNEPAHSTMM